MTRIGLAQILSQPGDSEANRGASTAAARALFERGADIVVLPELVVPWYATDRDALEPWAESLEGPTVTGWQALAEAHGGLVVGGLCEQDGSTVYNTAVAVDPQGVVAHYRKLHLFDAEKSGFEPGDLGLPVVATAHGTVGLCVCYDLRFVEVVRVLALRGAEVICVPTAWTRGFDRQLYNADGLCRHAEGAVVQANLNQVFIACASQVGRGDSVEFLGSSIVADPYGRLADGPLSPTDEQLQIVEIDIKDARRARIRGPRIQPRADRRTDVYGIRYGSDLL